jgi:hypothetical protein
MQDSGAGSSGRCHWKVFYPEQLIAAAGSPIHNVIVITKGAVRMKFPKGGEGLHARVKDHIVVASVGKWSAAVQCWAAARTAFRRCVSCADRNDVMQGCQQLSRIVHHTVHADCCCICVVQATRWVCVS